MTKQTTPHIPDQQHFSLDRIAKEWSTEPDHILELFEAGTLIPSIRLPQLSGDWWQSTTYPIWIDDERGYDWDGERTKRQDRIGAGTWYLPGFQFGHTRIDEHGNRHLLLDDCFLSSTPTLPTEWFVPATNPGDALQRVNLSALLVSQDEKERFTRANQLFEDQTSLKQREKRNLLRTIGALLRLYVVDKGNQYGTPDSVNRSQVIDALHRHLELNRIDTRGMEASTLHRRFTEAIQEIRDISNSN